MFILRLKDSNTLHVANHLKMFEMVVLDSPTLLQDTYYQDGSISTLLKKLTFLLSNYISNYLFQHLI